MSRLCALVLLFGLLLACGDSPTRPTGSLTFTTLVASQVPGSAGPGIQAVVRDAATWSALWSELWQSQPPALPAVDFSRDMVVLVTATETCFGRAEVEEITIAGDRLVIRYGDAAPSLCLCIQPSLAFHAVRLQKLFGDARFEAKTIPPACPNGV